MDRMLSVRVRHYGFSIYKGVQRLFRTALSSTGVRDPSVLFRFLVAVNIALVLGNVVGMLRLSSGAGGGGGGGGMGRKSRELFRQGSKWTVVVVESGGKGWRQMVTELGEVWGRAGPTWEGLDLEVWEREGQRATTGKEGDWKWEYGEVRTKTVRGWYDVLEFGWQGGGGTEGGVLFVTDRAEVSVGVVESWVYLAGVLKTEGRVVGVSFVPARVMTVHDNGSVEEWDVEGSSEEGGDGVVRRRRKQKLYLYRYVQNFEIFAPRSKEIWALFRQWFVLHRYEKFLWPVVHHPKDKNDKSWTTFRGTHAAPLSLWLTRFNLEHDLFCLYPTKDSGMATTSMTRQAAESLYAGGVADLEWYDIRGRPLTHRSTGMELSKQNINLPVKTITSARYPLLIINTHDERSLQSWFCSLDALGIKLPATVVFLVRDDDLGRLLRPHVQKGAIVLSGLRSEASRAKTILDYLDVGQSVLYLHAQVVWSGDFLGYLDQLVGHGGEVIGAYHRSQISNEFIYLKASPAVIRTWREVIVGLKADRETKQPRTESMISRLSNLLFYGDNFTAMNPVTFMAIAKEFTLVSAEIGCIRSLDEMPSAVVLPTIIHGGEPSKIKSWLVPVHPTKSQPAKSYEGRKKKKKSKSRRRRKTQQKGKKKT